jgi:hypothetical protein
MVAKKQTKTPVGKMSTGGGLFGYGQMVDKKDKIKPLFPSWEQIESGGKTKGKR